LIYLELNAQYNRMLKMNAEYSDTWAELDQLPQEDVRPGRACVAMCNVDHCWYRAEILRVNKNRGGDMCSGCAAGLWDSVDVMLVDYGSTDNITHSDR